MTLITDAQILRAIGNHATVSRGQEYFRQGRARILSCRLDGGAYVIESEGAGRRSRGLSPDFVTYGC